jgi:ABC-type branched-subunit amino acid transport system ATPase component
MTALLQVRGLTKKYLGLTAVDDVSYEVEAGTIVGLIGPNGSGKSTSIDCISGFQPANGGQWSLGGVDLTGLPPHRIARAGLTRSFQTVRAYDELTLLENLCVAAQETDGVGWLQALWRGKPPRAPPKRVPTTCWPPSAWPTTPPPRPRSCPMASASCSPSPPA